MEAHGERSLGVTMFGVDSLSARRVKRNHGTFEDDLTTMNVRNDFSNNFALDFNNESKSKKLCDRFSKFQGCPVRLVHMRSNIPCGVNYGCVKCYPELENVGKIAVKNNDDDKLHNLNEKILYLIDKRILMNQIDILEDPSVQNIIILQSDFDNLKTSNLPLFIRLKNCLSNCYKYFSVFQNTFMVGLYQPKKYFEDFMSYDINITIKSFKYLFSHLPNVKLLTDDINIYEKHIKDDKKLNEDMLMGKLIDLISYGKSHDKLIHIIDKIKRSSDEISCNFAYEASQMKNNDNYEIKYFDEHLDRFEIQCKMNTKSIHCGVFLISENVNDPMAYVILTDDESVAQLGTDKICIFGLKNRNRALNSEKVVVEVLPQNEWQTLATNQLIIDNNDEDPIITLNCDDEKKISNKINDTNEMILVPCGKIVGILQRKPMKYIGYIESNKISLNEDQNRQLSIVDDILPEYLFTPINKKIPNILIRSQQIEKITNYRIVVTVDHWPNNSQYPIGHFVKSLGKTTNLGAERECIDVEYDIPHNEFSREVMKCVPDANYLISAAELQNREDFRHRCVISIDPPDCKDIDDALHACLLENGLIEVGVHIADVSHYVLPNTALDIEASDRCTSVYLVDRRIDMIPTRLSTDICSLHPNLDKLTFSAIFEIDPKSFEVVKSRFSKSVIRSRAALSYEKAQQMIDDIDNDDSEMTKSLRMLNEIAKKMLEARESRGLIYLGNYSELKFDIKPNKEIDIEKDPHVSEYFDTKPMIAEFMLLANIYVARFIRENLPETAILRRHDHPSVDALKYVQNNLKSIKIDLDISSNKRLATSLSMIKDQYSPEILVLCQSHITRAMMQAKYFCASYFPRSKHYHYGLNIDCYTHFTSPIRRYADILVHRMLYAIISHDGRNNPLLTNRKALNNICRQINYRTRQAREASRASIRAYMKTYLVGRTIQESAYVYRLTQNGISLYIPKYLVELIVDFQQIKNDLNLPDLIYDPQRLTYCTNDTSKDILKYFDTVFVSLTSEYSKNGDLDIKCRILKIINHNK